MNKKKEVIAKAVGDIYIALHETGEKKDNDGRDMPGNVGIFKGKAIMFIKYSEVVQLLAFIRENRELCEKELVLEKERMVADQLSFMK